MIENPSEKDDIYLANVAKIGNSTNNIQYIENVLPEKDHKALIDYIKIAESWEEQPWKAITIQAQNSLQVYTPSASNVAARNAFQDRKFGMFIHWGASSVLGDGECR